jgi:hypothetical protein
MSRMSRQNAKHVFPANLEDRRGTSLFFHYANNRGNPLPFGLGKLEFIKQVCETLVSPLRACLSRKEFFFLITKLLKIFYRYL